MEPTDNAPLIALSVLALAVLAVTFATSVRRAWAPVGRWHRPPEIVEIRPHYEAERLITMLSKGPTRTQAATMVGDVRVSVHWVVDLTMPRLGWWHVKVGEHAGPAAELSVVYAVVRGRLAAIARERGQAVTP